MGKVIFIGIIIGFVVTIILWVLANYIFTLGKESKKLKKNELD